MRATIKDPWVMCLRDDNFTINSATHVNDIFMATSDKQRFMEWLRRIPFEFRTKVWVNIEVTFGYF